MGLVRANAQPKKGIQNSSRFNTQTCGGNIFHDAGFFGQILYAFHFMAYAAHHAQNRQHHFRPLRNDAITRQAAEGKTQQGQRREDRCDEDLQKQENQRTHEQHIQP
jgi:hypothetical protein